MTESDWDVLSEEDRERIRQENNPDNKPTGAFTGRCQRCQRCGSDDLWDDATVYGCNVCGQWYANQ